MDAAQSVSVERLDNGLTISHNLIDPSASPLSINGLLDISEQRETSRQALSLFDLSLEDNEEGADGEELRGNLAGLYSARVAGVTKDDIVLTSGAPAAVFTVLSTLLSAGDHVVCQHPANEQLYKVSQSLGVEISSWKASPSKKWELDFDDLPNLVQDKTKVIIIQSPCDPTGAIVPKPTLEKLIDFAREKSITIVADEVARPLFHSILPSDDNFPLSTINMGYRQVVVIGSFSTAYSLPGIRVGWIASRDNEIIKLCTQSRRLHSQPVSSLDEKVAAEVVSGRCIHALLARNIVLCQTNLALLQTFIDEHSWACSWVKPVAGTTALIKFHKMGKPVDNEGFRLALEAQQRVKVSHLGQDPEMRGYVRVAFGGSTTKVKAALEAWKLFMETSYDTVPTVANTPPTRR